MRESLQRRRGPWRFNEPRRQRSTARIDSEHRASCVRGRLVQVSRITVALLTAVLVAPAILLAQQSPWERAATNLEQTFTGPLARSLALVAIVIGGLLFMFGEGGAKRQISGIVFGGGLALFAAQFLTWLF
jgi:type IV secretory pathway VirB2 component (pilin)